MPTKKIRVERQVSLHEIRSAIANYMRSEGCGCCEDRDGHRAHKAIIAKMLKVPMYSDKSGYDFGKFETSSK